MTGAPLPDTRSGRGAARIGIDIGGTFTDVVLYDEASGSAHVVKLLTDHVNPARAVLDGYRTILDHAGTAADHADSARLRRRIDAVINLINRRTGKRHTGR